jgi:hypothetical protein
VAFSGVRCGTMQLPLSADVLVPIGVGVLVTVVAAIVLMVGLRRKGDEGAAPTPDDWTGEHVGDVPASSTLPARRRTVADAVAARHMDTDPFPAVSSSSPTSDWAAADSASPAAAANGTGPFSVANGAGATLALNSTDAAPAVNDADAASAVNDADAASAVNDADAASAVNDADAASAVNSAAPRVSGAGAAQGVNDAASAPAVSGTGPAAGADRARLLAAAGPGVSATVQPPEARRARHASGDGRRAGTVALVDPVSVEAVETSATTPGGAAPVATPTATPGQARHTRRTDENDASTAARRPGWARSPSEWARSWARRTASRSRRRSRIGLARAR